jgi:hypothetical protein
MAEWLPKALFASQRFSLITLLWDLWIFTSVLQLRTLLLYVIYLSSSSIWVTHVFYLSSKSTVCNRLHVKNIDHYVNQCQTTNGHKATTNVHF